MSDNEDDDVKNGSDEGEENNVMVEDKDNGDNEDESEEIVNEDDDEEEVVEDVEDEEEEPDNKEDNGASENQVHDPAIEKLINIDLGTANKEDVVKLLMQGSLLAPKPKKEEEKGDNNELITKKEKKKQSDLYKNTVSNIKQYLSGSNANTINYSKNDKFHIYKEGKDPEFTTDFNIATKKILNKLSNEENDEEVMKILFSDNSLIPKKENRKVELTREEIADKVNKALSKKQETIERIVNKCNEEYNQKHPFAPTINPTATETRRNFNQFLEDQKSHLNKVKEKIENIKEKEKEKVKKEKASKPTIDKNSETIFKEVVKSSAPVHLRLFNKKYQTAKTSMIQEKEKKLKEEQEGKPKKKKKNTLPVFEDNKDGSQENKEKRKKEKHYGYQKKEKHLMEPKDIPTNKILLNYFLEKFKNVTENYMNSLLQIEDEKRKRGDEKAGVIREEDQNEVEEGDNKNEEAKKKKDAPVSNPNPNNIQLTKLSLQQLHDVLHLLNMCSKPSLDSTTADMNESSIKQMEKKLVCDMWESLKNEENMVPVDSLKKFLICVISLHMYTLYESYKSAHSSKEIDSKSQNEGQNENATTEQKPQSPVEKIEFMITSQDAENSSKINQDDQRNNRYVSYSSNNPGEIIIPIQKAKKIKKDFNLLAITYMASRTSKKPVEKKIISFKPKIDRNSQKMSEKFREKILSEPNGKNDNNENNESKSDPHLEYIERIMLARKKRIAENQKIKEENEKKAMLECTFKPKMQNKSTIKKTNGANRFKELFIKGSEKEKNRKNRTQDDFDLEKHGKECTFQPNLIKEEEANIPETRFKNDIYNEKNYQLFYERIKNGKTERLIKEAVHDRFGLDDSLKDYVKKNKLKELKMQASNYEDDNEMQNSNEITNGNNEHEEDKNTNKSDTENKGPTGNESGNENQQSDENEGDIEKKEGIPLLIIDVNIRQGVKKKIYVFEGDTPEGLAEKFAKEHNLEPQTKEKLQNLIHSHMLRLLTRIDEENQSLSEKSGTTHMQKSQ